MNIKKVILFVAVLALIQSIKIQDFSTCLGKCASYTPDCAQDTDCKENSRLINRELTGSTNQDCQTLATSLSKAKSEDNLDSQSYLKCLTFSQQKLVSKDNKITKNIMQCNCLCAENLPEGQKTQCTYNS